MAFRPHAATSGAPTPAARVVPAEVSFLTIYNPTFGDTEETEEEQIVLWVDKDDLGAGRIGRTVSKSPVRSGDEKGLNTGLSEEQITNTRLRQVGLARGMVEFARTFNNTHDLDTIETDRARIVLYELEKDWWILASIDLTQLPAAPSQSKSNDNSPKDAQSQVEFSAREVSPAILLRTQLIKAHKLFLLHHATTLWELYNKLGRRNFISILSRYWTSFTAKWDVLLHGNPALDMYGDCVKLSGGGELGVGVGEEEWGSGEREVLEGFVERAEGLIECVVGRYGNAPAEKSKKRMAAEKGKRLSLEEKIKIGKEIEDDQWLGTGEDPSPADGVIFSGMGVVSRKSLATISQWMEAIFKHGETAYGIGENPASRPRQRRKRPKVGRQASNEPSREPKTTGQQGTEVHPRFKSPKKKAPDYRKKAIVNNAAPPGIPAPLVGAVEKSLDDALAKADERADSKSPGPSPKSSPTQERSQDDVMKGSSESKDDSSSVFSMDGVKNMLSFGYGSSWTLSPAGFDKKDDQADSQRPKTPPAELLKRKPTSPKDKTSQQQRSTSSSSRPAEERLQEIDPAPQVSDEDNPFVQKLEQSMGKFLIGLSGDLENNEFQGSDEEARPSTSKLKSNSQRIFLRTLTVELANARYCRPGLARANRSLSQASDLSKRSAGSGGSVRSRDGPEPKTSAAASVDGAKPVARFEKVQVAVYVHQPFVFVFLFELHTAKLTMPTFYRNIHHQLGPLQKPLLQRTDPSRIAERIATALNEKSRNAADAVKKHMDNSGNAIYDLVYDLSKNTIRTSIPNIPIPTSPDAAIKTSATVSGSWYTLGIPMGTSNSPSSVRIEPIGTKSKIEPWTRVEALNVHTQILNTFSSTRSLHELERTVKTARAWWVLWMKVASPNKEDEEFKEAFLVRKSADYTPSGQPKDSRNGSGSAGRWLLRDQRRDTSGSNAGSPGAPGSGSKGVSEGLGIDARKWIEGLLSLTQ